MLASVFVNEETLRPKDLEGIVNDGAYRVLRWALT